MSKHQSGSTTAGEAGASEHAEHHHLTLRQLEASDYTTLVQIMDLVYEHAGGAWTEDQYNINIVAGSMPVQGADGLRNVCYLLRRDGTWDYQYKIHPTPPEEADWALNGGDDLRLFDTDEGKVGILVCYDVQFPELPRLLAEQGMQILFVPYLPDTRSGYVRVRSCCQARAIENECYVVATGSTGSIPNLAYIDIHYSQSVVFTPSDFIFPPDGIKAEATPNTETTLITDLDLGLLRELREHGSVRNFRQRRRDLYSLKWIGPGQVTLRHPGEAGTQAGS